MRRVLVPAAISPLSPPAGGIVELSGETMGTTWSVRLVDTHAADTDAAAARQREWRHGIQRQLDTVVTQMSHWLPDSDLGRFNRAPAGCWQRLPPAFFEVLGYALDVAAATGGACDPTAGALVNAWGFGPEHRYDEPGFTVPDTAAIETAHAAGGWQRLTVDRAECSIRQPGGLQLDLSAVAKGYGVDLVAQFLARAGIAHCLVEVGGELRGAGMKPDGMPWWVELEQPPAAAGATAAAPTLVALHGLAVATSGDYRRSYRAGDALCPHTIDPRSGRPIRNGIASVTVIHSSCMAADALSTALTVLGAEDGMAFAEQRGLAARFLMRGPAGLTERATPAFAAMAL